MRPGSWIDTGRYRAAMVLDMMSDPPHIMKLSYGDEVDEDFRPHITYWKSVPKRKRLPSLKDVFSPGDWIRHPYSGYGQLRVVRNSSMEIEFQRSGRVATCVPTADLSRWEKVDDPGPLDQRPSDKRLPPGTWIETDIYGRGVVLKIENRETTYQILAVLFGHDVIHITEPNPGEGGPVIWKLDRRAVDLHSPWGERWVSWWLNRDIFGAPACACCGYPNLAGIGSYFAARECAICGYPDFGTDFEDDDVPRVLHAGGYWRHRNAWDFPDDYEADTIPPEPSDKEWKINGYSLQQARLNYEARGHMYRPEDPNAVSVAKVVSLKHKLTFLINKRMAEPSLWIREDWIAFEETRQKVLDEIQRHKRCSGSRADE